MSPASQDPPKVFISYSHDSLEHKDSVRSLSNRLRREGIDSSIDQYEQSPPEGWPRWMERQIEVADFVLVVCTETYLRRFEGREERGRGLGGSWEGAILTQHLYEAQVENTRFVPVLLSSDDGSYVPIALRGTTRYRVDNEDEYLRLYRYLTDQPEVLRPELGQRQVLPPIDSDQGFTNEQRQAEGTEASVGGHPSSYTSAGPQTRRQGTFPSRPDLLMGREPDVEELLRLLNSTSIVDSRLRGGTDVEYRIVTVVGLPGVGKTTVAAELCLREETERLFPENLLWASLGPSPDLISILAGWSRAVGGPNLDRSGSVEEASLRLTAFMRGRATLVVADDVFEAEHVEALKVLDQGAMLVTSRAPEVAQQLTPEPECIYELGVLPEAESVELLKRLAPSLAEESADALHKLGRELDGLPLALRVAGRLLEDEVGYGWGVDELLEELHRGKRLLQSKAPGDTGGNSGMVSPTVEILLRTSYEKLDEASREAFRRLGIMAAKPATFDLQAAEALWSSEDGKDTMRTLVRRGLTEKAGNGRFAVHRVLIMFAALLLAEDAAEMHDVGKKHAEHFLQVLRRTKDLYFTDARQGAVVLRANWENIRKGWSWTK